MGVSGRLARPEERPDACELLFSSSGRLGRAAFLAGEGAVVAVLWLYDRWAGGAWRLATGWLVLSALLFAGCCLATRRLHDLGRAGWWTAGPFLLFLLTWPDPRGLVGEGARLLLTPLALWLALAPGQPRANRFGPALNRLG